jgi:hypothetical protein
MSGKIQNRESYIENGQFSGGVSVSPSSGSTFDGYNGDNPQFGFVAGGLYVGGQGSLVVKTVDNSVLTFVSASGFIPGLVSAVSGSSTATEILALK